MTPTKDELEQELASAERKIGRLESKLAKASEEAPAPAEESASGDHLATIEAEINAYLEENPDSGDGTHAHALTIQKAVTGLRDAQRAWRHLTESPPSAGDLRATEDEIRAADRSAA